MIQKTESQTKLTYVILIISLVNFLLIIFNLFINRQIIQDKVNRENRNKDKYNYCLKKVEDKRIIDWKERETQLSDCEKWLIF